MPLKIVFWRPQTWSRLKTLLLKHYCRRQGLWSAEVLEIAARTGVKSAIFIFSAGCATPIRLSRQNRSLHLTRGMWCFLLLSMPLADCTQ